MPKKKQKKSKKTTQKNSKRKRRKKMVRIKTLGKPMERALAKSPERTSARVLMLDIVVSKKCSLCKVALSSTILCNTDVDYCPKCLGLWFEEEELRWAKDEKDKDLNWLDIDLWKDEKKFKISYGQRLCPSCRVPLYEVYYGESPLIVDVCNLCRGIWLDRGEFKKIIDYLQEKADYEILHKYAKNLFEELAEIFIGPETLREEVVDFLTILKLFRYKFMAQHPFVSKMISQWISSSPK